MANKNKKFFFAVLGGTLFGIVLTVLCVYLISLAISWVLRRIPVVKKLLVPERGPE